MRPITRAAAALTTRKLPGALLAGIAAGSTFFTAGCASRGPLHVYTLAMEAERPILDRDAERTAEVPSFLEAGDRVSGFAYDPFTDHFFLRLDPGDRIRVVDRPARALKREFEIAGAPRGDGDLAVRPRDGHLFLLGAQPGQILRVTRFGKLVGEFSLAGATPPLCGLAFDSVHDHFLALSADGRRVTVHEFSGGLVRELRLEQPVGPSLAFDPGQREFYAPLRDRPAEIGVFAESGRLLRAVPASANGLVDVGPRSLVRMF